MFVRRIAEAVRIVAHETALTVMVLSVTVAVVQQHPVLPDPRANARSVAASEAQVVNERAMSAHVMAERDRYHGVD